MSVDEKAPVEANETDGKKEGEKEPPLNDAEHIDGKKIIARGIKGMVKWFSVRDGYGFINRGDTGDDIFVHMTAVAKKNPYQYRRSLDDGEAVEFDVVEGAKGPEAANVTGPDGATVKGSKYAVVPPFRRGIYFIGGYRGGRRDRRSYSEGDNKSEGEGVAEGGPRRRPEALAEGGRGRRSQIRGFRGGYRVGYRANRSGGKQSKSEEGADLRKSGGEDGGKKHEGRRSNDAGTDEKGNNNHSDDELAKAKRAAKRGGRRHRGSRRATSGCENGQAKKDADGKVDEDAKKETGGELKTEV